MSNVDVAKTYSPQFYNDSTVNNILATKEKAIFMITRTKDMDVSYDTFDNLIGGYLKKLPNNNVKTFVNELYNRKMIFMGNSSGPRNDAVFGRLLLDPPTSINGVVLDSTVLDIDILSGNTTQPDDCIYAAYSAIVRGGILLNKDRVGNNIGFHKLITNYIFLLFLKGIGQQSFNEKSKTLIYMVTIYLFYTHFLNYKGPVAITKIKKDYKQFFKEDYLNEFLPVMSTKIINYKNIKDFPKVLIDLNLYSDNPSKIYIDLLRLLGSSGFYSLISSLDQLVMMAVVSKYPTSLYGKGCLTSQNVHESIESEVKKYMTTIKYKTSQMFYKSEK